MTCKCSASIMCADWLNMGAAVAELEDAGCDMIHCDVMDGSFVPNLMMPDVLIEAIAARTKLPLDVHLMVYEPERLLRTLPLRPGDYVSLHYESTVHLQRAVALAKEKQARVLLALNPATPVELLRDLLGEVDGVLLMTVNPGFAGQKITPSSVEKARRTRRYLDELGYAALELAADGNCSLPNIAALRDAGVNIFVLGTSAIYRKELSLRDGLRAVRAELERS